MKFAASEYSTVIYKTIRVCEIKHKKIGKKKKKQWLE